MITFQSGEICGELKHFNRKKGFGHIQTKEGRIFLHISKVRKGLVDQLIAGATLEVVYQTSARGLEATKVLSITEPPVYTGTVKFFNVKKGFGFIKCLELGDVFLPRAVASAAGVIPWERLAIEFTCAPDKTGKLAATMIRPATDENKIPAMPVEAEASAAPADVAKVPAPVEEILDEPVDDGKPKRKKKAPAKAKKAAKKPASALNGSEELAATA